jgi:hypothetical protein
MWAPTSLHGCEVQSLLKEPERKTETAQIKVLKSDAGYILYKKKGKDKN